jgi:DNA integrity scanning protein DisA with diadenylate cyclase activity
MIDMQHAELMAAIEEASDASLSDYAARNPEDAAAVLDYLATNNEELVAQGIALTFEKVRRDAKTLAKLQRMLAVELRLLVAQREAA